MAEHTENPNFNINVNSTNQIKLAQQQKANQKNNSNELTKQSITKAIGTGFSNIDTGKFIQEINKSAIFQKMSSSLNKLVQTTENSKEVYQKLDELNTTLNSIAIILESSNKTQNNNDKKFTGLGQELANNSFFKDLFSDVQDIHLYFQQKKISEASEKTNAQTNVSTDINTNLESIVTIAQAFSDKLQSIDTSVTQILNSSDTSITKDDLTSLLTEFNVSLSEQNINKLSQSITENNKNLLNQIKQAIIDIKISLPPIDLSNVNQLETFKTISTNIDLITQSLSEKQDNNIDLSVLKQLPSQINDSLTTAISDLSNKLSEFLSQNNNNKTDIKIDLSSDSSFKISETVNIKLNDILKSLPKIENKQSSNKQNITALSENNQQSITQPDTSFDQMHMHDEQQYIDQMMRQQHQSMIQETQQTNQSENNIQSTQAGFEKTKKDQNKPKQSQIDSKQTDKKESKKEPIKKSISIKNNTDKNQSDIIKKESSKKDQSKEQNNEELIKNIFNPFVSTFQSFSNLISAKQVQSSNQLSQSKSDLTAKQVQSSNQLSQPKSDLTAKPVQSSNQLSQPKSDLTAKPVQSSNQLSQPKSDLTAKQVQSSNQLSQPKSDLTAKQVQSSNQLSQPKSDLTAKPITKSQTNKNPQISIKQKIANQKSIPSVVSTKENKENLKKLQTKKIQIDTNISDITDNIQTITEEIDDSEKEGYICQILDGQQAEIFLEQINSQDITELDSAILSGQIELKKLIEDTKNEQYEKYKERINVYIQTLQKLLSLAQSKKAKLLEKENTENAIKSLNDLSVISSTTAKKDQIKPIETKLVQSGKGSAEKQKLSFTGLETKQYSTGTEVELGSKKTSESNSKENDGKKQQEALNKLFDSIDLENPDVTAYCKKYVSDILNNVETEMKEHKGQKYKLDASQIIKYGQMAKASFLSQLQNQKILKFDIETKQNIVSKKKDVLQNQAPPEDIMTYKTVAAQKKEKQAVSNTPVTVDNNETSSQNNSQINQTVNSFVDNFSKDNQQNKKIELSIKDKNKKFKEGEKLSQDTSLYDFSPHTDKEDYNNEVIRLKTNYITDKHRFSVQNKTLTKDSDKIASQQFDDAYKNDKLLIVDKSSFDKEGTPKLIVDTESVKEKKQQHGATDKLTEEEQIFSKIDKLFDSKNNAKNKTMEEIKVSSGSTASLISSNKNLKASAQKISSSSDSLVKPGIQLKNVGSKLNIGPSISSLKEVPKKALNNISSQTKSVVSTGKEVVTNTIQSGQNILNNNFSQMLKQLKIIADKPNNSSSVQPVYIPVQKDGVQVALFDK